MSRTNEKSDFRLYEKWFNESTRLVEQVDAIRANPRATDKDVAALADIRDRLARLKESYRRSLSDGPARFVVVKEYGTRLNSAKLSLADEKCQSRSQYKSQAQSQSHAQSHAQYKSQAQFRLTPVQKLIRSYFSPGTDARGLLLFHGVGVGKTCTAISCAEAFADSSYRVRVYCPGAVIDQFKRQVFDASSLVFSKETSLLDVEASGREACTGTRYVAPHAREPRDARENIAKAIENAVKERYDVQTFYGLHRACQDIRDDLKSQGATRAQVELILDERLRQEFSRSLIIVDEVHNLRDSTDDPHKLNSEALMRIARAAVDLRILLLTATPMFDRADEAIWILNLLRANDSMPIISEEASPAEIAEAADSYVSYAPSGHEVNPELYPRVVYERNPRKVDYHDVRGPTLYLSDAVGHQARHLSNSKKKEESSKKKKKSPAGMSENQAIANAYFPTLNGSLHEAFAERNVGRGRVQLSYDLGVLRDHGEFLDEKNCKKYAAKIAAIVESLRHSSGPCFVFSNLIDHGLVPTAVALEHAGFKRDSQHQILDSKASRRVMIASESEPKYRILCGSHEHSDDFESTIKKFTSVENADGSVLKVLLGSSVVSEGIDLKNIDQVHILEPWWNMNKIKQTIGRAVRRCSHSALPPERRVVRVFLHALVSSQEKTIDVKKYETAAFKGHAIAAVEKEGAGKYDRQCYFTDQSARAAGKGAK